MACVVLHNILHQINDDDEWLQDEILAEPEEAENEREQERYVEIQSAGIQRRDELRDLVVEFRHH